MLEKGQFTEAQLREMNGDKLLEAINANKDLYANAPDRGGMVDTPTYGPRVEGGQFTTDGMREMGVNNRDRLPGMGETNRGGLSGMGQLGGLGDWGAYPSPDAGQLTQGIGRKGDIAQAQGMQGSQAQQTGQAAYDPQFADAAFSRQMSLMQPQMDRALEGQEVALRNQGLAPGTEAYDNALNDLRNQQGEQVGRAQLDAIREGRAAQGEEFSRGAEIFGQGRSLDDYGLRSGQQAFGQEQSMGRDYDTARQRDFDENSGVFQGQLDQANYANQLRGLQNSEQLSRAGFHDNQNQQQYEQDLGYAGFDQGRRNDMVNEDLAYGAADDGRSDRDFARRMEAANYQDSKQKYDDAYQMQGGQDLFNNQMTQQQWAQQLRDQYITEGNNQQDIAQNRGVSLANGAMINLSQPQFAGYNTYENPGGADYLSAANMKGQFDTANQKPSFMDSLVNTGAQLGSAYFMGR